MSFEVPTPDEYFPAVVVVTFKENGSRRIQCPKPTEYLSEHPAGDLEEEALKVAHTKWDGDTPAKYSVEVSQAGYTNFIGEGDHR